MAVLRKYPHSIHAVQHGNPYVHVQIADTFDGSAFEVWSLADDEMVIVPQLHSTEAAVERLVHYVYEEFREGTITDYES